MKKTISFLLLFLFLITNTALAYSVDTHKILSEKATENSKLALDKGDYLNNLGFQDNIDEEFSGNKVIDLIKQGSVDEDKSSRYVNHYHNPLKSWPEAGLFDMTAGYSSLVWAQQDVPHEFPNEFSWQAVRRYYLDALTTGSEDSFVKTFKGLGHIIHLIQDTAQPAHVRNDAHVLDPLGLPPYYNKGILAPGLETWSNAKREIIEGFASSPDSPAVDLSTSLPGYGSISQFFDVASDGYDGTNPSTSLSQGLAEYTNANFLSEDTIFTENFDSGHKHYFPFPRKEDTVEYDEYIEGEGKYRTYFKKIQNGETVNHLATIERTYVYLYSLQIPLESFYFLDERCHEDYTEKLIPRAVGYSTELIDYFFRGELEIIQISNTGIIKIKNNSSEDLDGTFTLYYDAADGFRKQVSDGSWYLSSLQAGDTSGELSFAEPTDFAEGIEYILVFEGTLGSESNAVVGKVWSNCNNTTAIFVAGPASGSIGEYDFAVVSASLDPAKTNWIVWNDTPQVQLTRSSRPGEVFLGPGSFGTNDYITLTVVAPSGASQTVDIDRNDAYGVSYGIQNVIFGATANAPDVFRQNPSFANPPNQEYFLDEAGSHNSIFSESGIYEFQFSFRDESYGGGGGNHGNIYLLINDQCQGVTAP